MTTTRTRVVCYSVLQCVAMRCNAWQCVAVCRSVLRRGVEWSVDDNNLKSCCVLQCVAMRCSVLQCVTVCCSVSQCAAAWY